MKIALGEIMMVGDTKIAAVRACDFNKYRSQNAMVLHGQTIPLVILVCRLGQLRAFHVTGAEMPLDDLQKICPHASEIMLASRQSF